MKGFLKFAGIAGLWVAAVVPHSVWAGTAHRPWIPVRPVDGPSFAGEELRFWEWDAPRLHGSVTDYEAVEDLEGTPGARLWVRFQKGRAIQAMGSQWYGEAEFSLPAASVGRGTNWDTRYRVSLEIRIGEGLVNAFRHHRARLYLVDVRGKRQYLPNEYIGLRPPATNGWIRLQGRPAHLMPIPLGFTDGGFRADQIVSIGVNVEAGGREGEVQEDWVELRNLRIEDLGTRELKSLKPEAQIIQEESQRSARMTAHWRTLFGTAPHEGRSIYGVNLAWPSVRAPDGQLYHLYGSFLESRWTSFGRHWDLARNSEVEASLRRDFKEIRELFGPQAIVRIFLFADLQSGIVMDAAGVPQHFTATALQSLDILFRLAQEESVVLMPVVFDFLMADGKANPGPAGDWLLGEAPHLITRPDARSAMVRLIGQLAHRYQDHPALLAWDIMNEPENAVAVVTPEHWIDLQTFLKEAVDAVQANGALATVGHRNPFDARHYFRGVLRSSLGQAHYYPNLETQPAPFGLDLPQARAFGQVPAGWGEAPARPGRIDADFEAGRKSNAAYFLFWSWRGDDENADGFRVRGYRDEIARALRKHGPIPYLFTMDDFPMWFVQDPAERLRAYEGYRQDLKAHGTRGVLFLNGHGLDQSAQATVEWRAMNDFRNDGHVLANHGARHKPLSEVPWEEFWRDTLDGVESLNRNAPDWNLPQHFYRFPNSEWGRDAEHSCRKVTAELGATILPVTADLKDYTFAERYHFAADARSRERIAQEAFDLLQKGVAEVRARRQRRLQSATSPEIFIMHSTRFARDHLDAVLTALEKQGVRWVGPAQANLEEYLPSANACVPACKKRSDCR